MRIDRWVSQATDLSRKQVHQALRNKRLSVNEAIVKSPSTTVGDNDCVTLDGQRINAPQTRYFMLNKPEGYLCATSDGHQPIVLDLIAEPNTQTLQIVGRLDLDTTGLLLITDDGKWNHRITSPRSQCEKTYLATLAEPLCETAAQQFAAGMQLRNESQLTRPAQIETLADNRCRVTISEGKYHQVKRMFGALNNRVIALHRERIGNIALDPALAPGQYRALTPTEIISV